MAAHVQMHWRRLDGQHRRTRYARRLMIVVYLVVVVVLVAFGLKSNATHYTKKATQSVR